MTQLIDPPAPAGGAGSVPALIVADGERRRLMSAGPWGGRLRFYDRIDALRQRLDDEGVSAVIIETRDADGFPVPAGIRQWVERHPQVPVIVWTSGSDGALREVLDLAAAGADVRLILRWRDELAVALDRLLLSPAFPHPGAIPALLRGVVLPAPATIHTDLTLAAYHAWPHPSVSVWAHSHHLTRQALNARLGAARYAPASVVMDAFSAAEIAIRCTLGIRLKDIAAAMGKPDDRPLRRRLRRLRAKPEHLRDEADFRALIPRIVEVVRR